ncbi:hypothetical protein EUZ85_19175 [Hahella sp. KA22]|uniref:hypothetical protein n=1 Tax=Hahella sp. KA22 TaxID=1628392 RepID=UPI000FDDDDD4|nr:hypothetical protein [Hahella sp. KA22]AZZ92729.1 hypothetical protein ENC22_16595 [Hahella sp. KA22]QAY56103.1 hypothetical protein EUZ85_19175 [Hahella sp. KA22]
MAIILGIHSNVASGEYTSGHAWISVTEAGITTRYGLWPDAHPKTVDNGVGTDIRKNMEPPTGVANRYYQLTPEQTNTLRNLLLQNVTWTYTNTCASWASEVVYQATGKDVDADDWGGFETPRELGTNIVLLEAKDPTSKTKPKILKNAGLSSW